MGVLDDLEAALAEPPTYMPNLVQVLVRAADLLQALAVCRAAVAYREAHAVWMTDKNAWRPVRDTKKALLAATEGLT